MFVLFSDQKWSTAGRITHLLLCSHQACSIQVKVMSVAPAECYLTQYMACFKQLGHFELLRDRMLYHFSETPQQQQVTREMSER